MKRGKSNRIFLGLILVLAALMLVISACSPAGSPTTTTPGPSRAPSTTAAGSIDLTAQNMAFDKQTITVKAGASVTINFNNKDSGVPHNFAVYNDQSASQTIFKGDTINGPGTKTYTFTAPNSPGTYFFRCDIHPTTMTGQFIVQ